MTDATLQQRFFSESDAARYLGISPRTLEKKRQTNDGPVHRKFGRRVLYEISDLDAWADSCRATESNTGPSDPSEVESTTPESTELSDA